MPWLCGTAYLHSVLVQERRGPAAGVEPLAVRGHLRPHHPRHLPHPLGGDRVGARLLRRRRLGPLLIGFFVLVVVVGFGLIAWRGDRLRSPGGIDAPLGREGAFLVNNLLFVGFAFVVLLGTLFPLLYQAVKNQQVTVGAPYFNTVAVPVGLALLFLMAVAPALSWRKVDAGVLWHRLAVPAWVGCSPWWPASPAGCAASSPCWPSAWGPSPRASAGRSLVLSVRASRHGVRAPGGAWSGGPTAAWSSTSAWWCWPWGWSPPPRSAQSGKLALRPGQVVAFDGHTFVFERTAHGAHAPAPATEALVQVDGGGLFCPAVSQYGGANSEAVGTPAIDSGVLRRRLPDPVGRSAAWADLGGPGVANLPAGCHRRRGGGRAARRLDVGGRPAHRAGRPAGPGARRPPPADRPGLGPSPLAAAAGDGDGDGDGAGAGRARRRRRARAAGRAPEPGGSPAMSALAAPPAGARPARRPAAGRRHTARWVAGGVAAALVSWPWWPPLQPSVPGGAGGRAPCSATRPRGSPARTSAGDAVSLSPTTAAARCT